MTTAVTTEFPVDLATNDRQGTVIITDPRLLIRPAVPGQYPASARHDTGHVYDILELGNDTQGGCQWHIVCQEDPNAAHELLHPLFHAYVDAACMELWCEARVLYIVEGETVLVKEYGFDDGRYTMVFRVYCGVAADQAEKLIARLIAEQSDNFFVIRPDDSELGFNIRGFTVERLDEGDMADPGPDADEADPGTEDAETEDPLAGDVEPTGGYLETEGPHKGGLSPARDLRGVEALARDMHIRFGQLY